MSRDLGLGLWLGFWLSAGVSCLMVMWRSWSGRREEPRRRRR